MNKELFRYFMSGFASGMLPFARSSNLMLKGLLSNKNQTNIRTSPNKMEDIGKAISYVGIAFKKMRINHERN